MIILRKFDYERPMNGSETTHISYTSYSEISDKPLICDKNNLQETLKEDVDSKSLNNLESLLSKNFKTGEIPCSLTKYRLESMNKHGRNTYTSLKKPLSFQYYLKKSFTDPILLILAFLSLLSFTICFFRLFYYKEKLSLVDFLDSILILIGISFLGFYGAYNDHKFSKGDYKDIEEEYEYPTQINNSFITSFSSELTVGDIILINAGDEIPADCLILPYLNQKTNLEIDESVITGESAGQSKSDFDFLLAGSFCLSGIAKCLIIKVGENTKKGSILKNLSEDENKNDYLQMKSKILMTKILHYTCFLCAVLFVGSLAFNMKNIKKNGSTVVINFLMESISIAALIIPEGLPFCLTMTIVFIRNSLFSNKASVRVKNKEVLDDLNSLRVLCFDKTGTLTHNILILKEIKFKIKDEKIILSQKTFKEEISNLNLNIPILRQNTFKNISSEFMQKNVQNFSEYLLLLYRLKVQIILNSLAVISEKKNRFIGNKLDIALLENFSNHQISEVRENYENIRIIPHNSKNKCQLCIIRIPEIDRGIFKGFEYAIFIKGAPEILKEKEDVIENKNNICIRNVVSYWIPIISIDSVLDLNDDLLIEYAIKSNKMDLINLSFEDPIRENAAECIDSIQKSGIKCIIVTGDSLEAGIECAEKIGLIENKENIQIYQKKDRKRILEIDDVFLESSVFQNLSKSEIFVVIRKLRVLGRCKPEDKVRLIKILQELYEYQSIGICGDGINDAMAMKRADVSFSFSNCTSQIPKNTASIILEKNYLKGLLNTIKYAKSAVRNIRCFISFQISVAAALFIVCCLGIFLNFEKPESLKTYEKDYKPEFMNSLEILYLNFFVDALSCLFFSKIKPNSELLSIKIEEKGYPIITNLMRQKVFFNVSILVSNFVVLYFLKFDRLVLLLNFLNNVLILSIFSHKVYENDSLLKNFINNPLSMFLVMMFFVIQTVCSVCFEGYFNYKFTKMDFLVIGICFLGSIVLFSALNMFIFRDKNFQEKKK